MFHLKEFETYREDNRREVKKAAHGLPMSLWETYSSFSNSYGGVMILGVSELEDGSWKVTGLKDAGKLLKEFWDIINSKQKVSANLLRDDDVEVYEEDGNIIMVIYVPKASREEKPIYINGDMMHGTYRRNWEGDYKCSIEEVKGMLRDQPERTMDSKILDDIDLQVLMTDSLRAYRMRHVQLNPGHPWEDLTDETYLEKIEAAAISKVDGKLHPTAAGLLMFGKEYQIVREFPEYFLDYREMLDPAIRWTDRFQSSSGDWSGNLYDFYYKVYNKLQQDVKVPFKIVGDTRIDDTPVHKALREALVNCLVNADFFGRQGIVVKKELDNIVIENPGSIRTGKKQMLRGGISDPRNKTLMKMFHMIKIGERAGSGVPDIYKVWEQEGWDAPKVEERFYPDRTILTLPFHSVKSNKIDEEMYEKSGNKKVAIKSGNKKVAIKSGDKKVAIKTIEHYDKILAFMEADIDYGLSDFLELLDLKRSRIRKLLNDLVKAGNIEISGSNRNRRYHLVKPKDTKKEMEL